MWRTASVITAASLLMTVQAAIAQQKSVDIRILYTMTYSDLEGWTVDPGTVFAIKDGETAGAVETTTAVVDSSYHGKMGHDRSGISQFVFTDGTIDISDYHANYEFSPGKSGSGTYHGVGRIAGGTGVYANATGSYAEIGPFILWPDEQGIFHGKYMASGAFTIYLRR